MSITASTLATYLNTALGGAIDVSSDADQRVSRKSRLLVKRVEIENEIIGTNKKLVKSYFHLFYNDRGSSTLVSTIVDALHDYTASGLVGTPNVKVLDYTIDHLGHHDAKLIAIFQEIEDI